MKHLHQLLLQAKQLNTNYINFSQRANHASQLLDQPFQQQCTAEETVTTTIHPSAN